MRIIWARLFRPRKLLPIPLNDPALFTPTPRWQDFLRQDPLRLHRATARLLIESVRLDRYLRHVPKYVHVPVLLLLAQRTRIIHNAKTRTFVDASATKDKQVIRNTPGRTILWNSRRSLIDSSPTSKTGFSNDRTEQRHESRARFFAIDPGAGARVLP